MTLLQGLTSFLHFPRSPIKACGGVQPFRLKQLVFTPSVGCKVSENCSFFMCLKIWGFASATNVEVIFKLFLCEWNYRKCLNPKWFDTPVRIFYKCYTVYVNSEFPHIFSHLNLTCATTVFGFQQVVNGVHCPQTKCSTQAKLNLHRSLISPTYSFPLYLPC